MLGLAPTELTGEFLARIALAAAAGIVLGLVYYGGLWWTVRRLQVTKHPGLLFTASFLVRTAIVLVGLFAVSGGDWFLISISLVLFIVVRMVLTRRFSPETGG